MRLDFKTIWFDNSSSSFHNKKEVIRSKIERLGFNFVQPTCHTVATNLAIIDLNEYNVIFADLELMTDPLGLYLIESIRDGSIIADVVIYSSKGEDHVRNSLLRYKIDGIYCSGKKEDDFEIKIDKVLNRIIKRRDNLNNIRGLVMAETSLFSSIMNSIITNALYIKDFGSDLINFIYDDVDCSIEEKRKEYEKYNKNREVKIEKLIKDNIIFDVSKKMDTVQYVLNQLEVILDSIDSRRYEELYEKDINAIRNDLAHVVTDTNDDMIYITANGKKNIMNQDRFVKIRKLLKKHKTILENIDKYVKFIRDNHS